MASNYSYEPDAAGLIPERAILDAIRERQLQEAEAREDGLCVEMETLRHEDGDPAWVGLDEAAFMLPGSDVGTQAASS